ncbi:hypothetical protein VMCG_00763 [Cytospora schulzeri]|uniref:PXA domain-containing protein n=1 Tax=Cytospora schulzeri TaxID=448051 RepID=A0A423X7W5_9PEZI|nr:hypothetical protein VMCG_00763 [Valsa malicola]
MNNQTQLKTPASPSSSSTHPSPDPLTPLTPATAPSTTQTDVNPRPRSKHSRTISNVSSSSAKRRSPRSNPSDFLSDRATAQLIRRVLCPQQVNDRNRATLAPVDELLPPLTSRNDVDIQLYAIIAIILRDFVQTWYNKITPDETLVAEIVQIIAHCSRTLEHRLKKVDLESLLFDELPDLLDKHVEAYRASRKPLMQPPIEVDPREIYHSLCPLPHLSPIPKLEKPETIAEQAENEVAYRQLLVQGVLAVLLPTEDLKNQCLTSLVGQIFSEIIIGGVVAKKLSEPWMLWTGLTILADVMQRGKTDTSGPPFVRVFASTLATCRTLPSRGQTAPAQKDGSTRHNDEVPATNTSPPYSVELPKEVVKTPVVAYGIWPTVSNLLEMDKRMPWLCGSLSMVQWLAIAGPGRVAGFDGVIDRLLSDSIQRHILDPATLPTALRNLRGALFPNNAMGSPTLFPPGSDQELLALRRKCASALWTLVPRGAGRLFFGGTATSWLARCFSSSPPLGAGPDRDGGGGGGGGDEGEERGDDGLDDLDAQIITEIETDMLDVFSDAYCNKHLMYGALELILVRIMPELAEKGVVELWEERLK